MTILCKSCGDDFILNLPFVDIKYWKNNLPICEYCGKKYSIGQIKEYYFQHSDFSKYKIFVFECENNKYYIGKTTYKVETEFKKHLSERNKCNFTKTHKPIKIFMSFTMSEYNDIHELAEKFVNICGINNINKIT